MKKIEYSNKKIIIAFEIDDEGKIFLTYLGGKDNFINRKSTFVEIETSQGDHLGSHCFKQCNTPFSKNARYVSHVEKENELVIVTSDTVLEVETHFVFYQEVSGFSIYHNVKNISSACVDLEYVSSFYLYALGQKESPTFMDMNVYHASNSWHTEVQWHKSTFIDADIFNGNDRLTMKKFVVNNTGSWSTKEYLPMIGVENVRTRQFVLGQIENNGSWHMEIGDNENQYYLSMCGPELMDNQWSKRLKEGETFQSVQASIVFAFDFESSIQEMTKLRRHLIYKKPDYFDQSVIFNDFMHGTWDLSRSDLIKPMVDTASEVGVDTFVLDAGWFFEKTGWTNYIGEYKEYSSNFGPHGLIDLFDYIRDKGMKVGLWFEIENIGHLSPLSTSLPEECFMHINGKRIMRNSRYCLNLANEKAFNHAYSLLADRINKYHLDYIKIDYNLDLGAGNDDVSQFLGEGLLEHNRALINLIQKLNKDFPNLTIENCASGGQRLDYQMLKYTQLVSSTDLENYYYYPYISGNLLTACLPEQAGIWSYPLCNDIKKFEITDEIVALNMMNAFIGRLQLASFINKLTPSQKEIVKEGVKITKSLNEFRKRALPIFPNGFSRFFDNHVVSGLINEDTIILLVYNMKEEKSEVTINLSKYNVNKVEMIFPSFGDVMYSCKNNDLSVSFPNKIMGRCFKIKISN